MSTIALTPVFYIVIILPFLTDIYATKNMEITKLLWAFVINKIISLNRIYAKLDYSLLP